MYGQDCERVEKAETDKACWKVRADYAIWFDKSLLMVIVWLLCGMRDIIWD